MLIILLLIAVAFVIGNILFIKRFLTHKSAFNTIFIVLTSILIFLIVLYEFYYYFWTDRYCSSGDSTVNLTWWSRLIGYSIFLIIYYYTIKCFAGLLRISKWNALIGFVLLGFVHYNNTFSMTHSFGGCGQKITVEHFYTSETIGSVIWEHSYCDTNTTFESLIGGIYGYQRKNNIMTFYRVNKKPVAIRSGFLFWYIENTFWNDQKEEMKREFQLNKNEEILRGCSYYKGKFKQMK